MLCYHCKFYNQIIPIPIRLFQSNLSNMKLPELLDLDYINIQDLPQLRTIIQTYQQYIDITVKEVQELTNVKDRNIAEGQIAERKMRAMQKQNLSRTKEYQTKIQQTLKKYEIRKAEVTDQHEKILQTIESKHYMEMSQLNDNLKAIREQQENLREKQIEEAQFLNEIKQKSSSLITKQYEHHDNMNKQQLKEIEDNRALFEKNKNMIKELKRDIKMEAGRIVYKEKYQNEDKNFQLKVKLFELQEQVTKLRKERNQIVKSRNEQKINVSLNEQEVEEYKAVGSIQKSKIKLYSDKVEAMKKTISSQISKLETKVKQKKSKWENQLKGSKLRLFNLEKQKSDLKINLERYKILGETILMQREEVEEFFLMAIETCKKQMAQSGNQLEDNEKQYGEKVDIDELLPKDKHRIITNLYTKLALASSK